MRYLLSSLVLMLVAAPALAETCKYIDKDGRTIFSNAPVKNARKVACFQPPAPPSPEPADSAGRARAPVPTEPNLPCVAPDTQRQRDNDRRQILEAELAREQDALNQAKKALADQAQADSERNYPRGQDRLKPYQDAVVLHQKNMASLQQEMANLK